MADDYAASDKQIFHVVTGDASKPDKYIYEDLPGYRVYYEGITDVDFCVVQDNEGFWRVYELSTRISLGIMQLTKVEAIRSGRYAINTHHGVEGLHSAIEYTLEKQRKAGVNKKKLKPFPHASYCEAL